jgi:hypothetical protein
MSDRCSAESEDSTTGSSSPDSGTPSSPSRTSGDAKSSPPASPESPSTPTSETSPPTTGATFTGNDWSAEEEMSPPIRAGADHQNTAPLVFVKSQHARDPEDCERWEEATTAPTLDEGGKAPRTATAVVTAFAQNQREEVRDLEGLASSLSAEPGTHQDTYVATAEPTLAPALTASWANNGGTGGFDGRDEAVLALTESQMKAETFDWQKGTAEESGRPDTMNLREEESGPLSTSRVPALLTSSAEASPARTSPSPGSGPGSPATDPASSSSSPESLSLFDPDGFSSRTYPVSSLATAVGTSESCLPRWPTSGMAWPTGFSTAATSECRSDAGGCSSSEPSLTEILEQPRSVPERYSLSARAARGILRRAQRRGRVLPPHLLSALEAVAGDETEAA